MNLSAVLLAGGESRRMGADKASIHFRGQPLWQHQLSLLRCLKSAKIFISVRKKPSWSAADVELLLDEIPSRGPMSGITAALRRMETSHLLVLAVDMPFILGADLMNLVSQTGRACGVVPVWNERAEPLAAVYPKEALSEFTKGLASDDNSLQPLIRELTEVKKVREVCLSHAQAARYRSLNTPADFIPAGSGH